MINQGKEFFDVSRFYHLLVNIIFTRSRSLSLYLGTFSGLVLFSAFLRSPAPFSSSFHEIAFNILLFPGGFLLTSHAFNEIDETHSRMDWLLLPCSIFEKYFAKLLLTGIIFSVCIPVFYSVVSYLVEWFYLLMFDSAHPVFNPFRLEIVNKLGIYIVIQSMFFLGAIFFRRYVFIKTIFSFWLFVAVLALLTLLVFKAVYLGDFSELMGNQQQFVFKFDSSSTLSSSFSKFTQMVDILFWYCTAPLFWWIGYRRLLKTEI
ncbi:MAG: hypothetical protein GY786_08185 [Proteobacteria bacterium]|nr:hypothetical protein [Pseudomonadota bacterium]